MQRTTSALALLFFVFLPQMTRAAERDVIVNNVHHATWAYHTDTGLTVNGRWYITAISSLRTSVFSLGPIVNGQAAWWTVGNNVATFNSALSSVSFPLNLDTDPSDTFWDIGLQQWVTNSVIHSDRQRLQGKTVPVKWYFFEAPNGAWYIVNAPGYGSLSVLRFSAKNGDYDWPAVDVSGYTCNLIPNAARGEMDVQFVPAAPTSPLVINGHTLQGNDDKWVRFVGATIVPQLLGDRNARIQIAATSSWWGLKEGTFAKANPHQFSSCSVAGAGDQLLGPLETCAAGRAWQVGLAAVQVPSFPEQTVLATVQSLWPGRSVTDVLSETARLAGYDPTQGVGAAIVASDGVLRKSWLLRHPAVGLTLVESSVTNECIVASDSWCYGTGWDQTSWYAPTKQAALQSINALTTIYENLAP